jgi:endo-1,4-beta-xylanase
LQALAFPFAVASVAACAGCIIQSGGAGGPVAPVGGNMVAASEVRPLRQAGAQAHRRIGTALMSHHLTDRPLAALVAREFDSLTPENEMKWESIEPSPGVFAFEAGDQLVSFAASHGMRMRGHTLVWHSQLAPWAKGLGRDALQAAMTRHIQNVVGHWKGKIAEWDVVNEALADGPDGKLRADSPFNALGPTYIDQAFRLAHDADPQALLFYNDYEIEGEGAPKSEAAYQLCKRLKEAGVPIQGVGFQMHVDPRHWPSAEQIRRNMERYAALGLLIEITEMDVAVGELPGRIDEKLQRQRALTHDIVAACAAVDKCSGITFWGVSDRESWLNSPQWGALRGHGPHYPLPFNADLQAKPMAAGIVEGLASGPK